MMVARGSKMSEESKRKMREAKLRENNPMYGIKHTKEAREKIRQSKMGENNPSWNGGKCQNFDGYILIKNNEHPNSDNRGYVFEHRLVIEKHLGRYLKPHEVVHHINGDVSNNELENLMLFENHAEHIKYHAKQKINKLERGVALSQL